MNKTSNDILVDRAIIRTYITFEKLEKLRGKALKNTCNRTTIMYSTLADLSDDLLFLNETLDQIKF